MLNDRVELRAAGSKGSDNRNLYVYGDHLGSAILALDGNQREAMRLGYSPFGQVYRKQNTTKFWKLNSGVNANNQLNQLMPYQYTGRYTEGATGYTHLDARWYNPYTQRFNQPDYWSFNNTGLPKSIQHELMRFSGLNTSQLLRDPAQQMRFGYVKNNPLSYIDLNGLDSFIGIRALDTNFPPWGTHSFTIISTTDTSQYGEHEDDFVEMVNTNGTWPGVGEGETFYVMTLAGFNDKGVLVSETDNLQDLAAIYSSLQEEHWTDVFVNDQIGRAHV